jgi:cyclopropane fatty-acyl-phospholipid synthase-like methyltransferase
MPNDETHPERVGRYYDEWTQRYQASFGNTLQACRPTDTADLHRYLCDKAGVQDGERILDAGCGVCGPAISFATYKDVTIDAVTVSKAQVEAARRLVAEAGLSRRIKVHLADFRKLHELFPEATFDRVLFLESLSHATDPTEPLRSVFHVLKPGGIVYIKDFFERSYDDADKQQLVREVIERVDREFVLKTPRVEHTVDVLKRIGFREQHVGPVGFTNDVTTWVKFNQAHKFDLFAGGEPFEWSEWLELRFQKPPRLDSATA